MTAPLGFWNIAGEDPTRTAGVDPEGRGTSYGELADLTNRYLHGFRALGLGAGDCVVFLGGRSAKQRRPHSLDFIAELPRDPNGKLYKRRLQDPYWERRARRI